MYFKNIALATGLAISGITVSSVCAPANAAIFGSNLIVNGDAEAGIGSSDGNTVEPIPGWTTSGNFTVVQYGASGGFPTSTDPGPSNLGLNFFAGGPNNALSSASQVIDVTSGVTAIDAGNASYNLSGFLGGFSSQGDNTTLTANFLNSSNSLLSSATISPVTAALRNNATGLLSENTLGLVPTGTRSISLQLVATRTDGAYNDGYADNLSLVLTDNTTAVPEPSTILGAVAGLGLITGLKRKLQQISIK